MDRQWVTKRNRADGVFFHVGQSEYRHRQREPRTFGFPIEVRHLRIFKIDHERIVRGQRIARFRRRYVSAQSVERGYGLAELSPLGRRSLLKKSAQCEFVVAAQRVADVRGQLSERADLCVHVYALLGGKRERSRRSNELVRRGHQRLTAAQIWSEVAKGSDAGGGIQPHPGIAAAG